MKIEKLTENKIRIIINIDELSEKNIDIHSLSKDTKKNYSFFQRILNEAEKQVGFKVQDCRLLIEAFSTNEGYIVFTFTKYKNEISTHSKKLKFKRKSLDNSYKNAIYQFNSFDEFCNFCTYCNNSNLQDLKQFAKNISFYEYKNTYYLVFSDINKDYKYLDLFYSSISEFAKLKSTSLVFKSNLIEYGNTIFKINAIKKGINFFVKGGELSGSVQ